MLNAKRTLVSAAAQKLVGGAAGTSIADALVEEIESYRVVIEARIIQRHYPPYQRPAMQGATISVDGN